MNGFEIGDGRTRVRFTWQRIGSDLHVHIGGGAEHVGAVALAGRQPDGGLFADVLSVPGHREDGLALAAAQRLHAATGATVCVTAGIHIDSAAREEIAAIVRNAEAGASRLADVLAGRAATPG